MTTKRRTIVRLAAVCGVVIAAALAGGCRTPISLLRERGLRAYDYNQDDKAIEQFKQILDRQPADWQANYYVGELQLEAGRVEYARLHLEQAYAVRSVNPTNAGVPPLDRPRMPAIVDALARAMYEQGDHRRLLGFCNEAIDRFETVRDYLRKADYLVKLGDPDNALVVYEQAARVASPDDPTGQLALADFYHEMGRRDQAIVALRKAYTISPDDPQIADRLRALGVVPGPSLRLDPVPEDR